MFTNEVLKRLVADHPEHEFIFLFDRPFSSEFVHGPNVTPVVIGPPARHPVLFYLWFEWSVAAALKKQKADVFFSPDGYLSLRSRVPSVHVVHDLAFEHYPKDVPMMASWHYRYYFPKYVQKAIKTLAVSEYTKADVVKQYGTDPSKISVVYNGAKTVFAPLDQSGREEVMHKYTEGQPFFLYVGMMHQRKNIVNLLKAYEIFAANGGQEKLLIVGRKAWGNADMEAFYEKMESRGEVIFTGRISDEELARVVASATALTYVSYFEGFGIPILEALKCGVPSITSNVSSMPEVAGDAGILVDPLNPTEIADAMTKMSTDTSFRKELVNRTAEQAGKFSWEQTAQKVWQAIEEAAP